jgi:L-alanine-DL-glutamate epimerase-like enolase superfamily enzyme
MKISAIEIRLCRHRAPVMRDEEMRGGMRSDLEFLVLTLKTDEGLQADTFGFAGRGAQMAGDIAASVLRPFFLGRDPMYRELHWHEFRMADRWWNHVPIYSYGPFDIACWLLGALAAQQPLYQYLGAYRDRVPIYGSSLVLPTPEDYARQALEIDERGWAAYKLHPPGDVALDRQAYRLCREAVGPDFKLMADPVAAYNQQQALRIGRELERLEYYWLEEPLFDVDFHGLRELTRTLDIPICGTEVLAGSHYTTAECIASHVVDIVRTDVSWKGGITATIKTAHLAEAFGLQCEIHTAIYHPLELVNLHCCAAIKNCEFFEVLLPWDYFDFGLKEPLRIEGGQAILPQRPGLGVELDWDFIDNCTFAIL